VVRRCYRDELGGFWEAEYFLKVTCGLSGRVVVGNYVGSRMGAGWISGF